MAKPGISYHFGHYPGDIGICRCNYAYVLSQEGRGYTLHNVPCGIRKRPTICGPVYKCKECVHFSICQNGYGLTGGGRAHAMHGFSQDIQKGMMPTLLQPCDASPRIVQPRDPLQRVLATPQIPMTPPSLISPELTNSPYSFTLCAESLAILSPSSYHSSRLGHSSQVACDQT